MSLVTIEPSTVPSLLIRADAGDSLGTGHVMRMLALAQAWRARGGAVHLVGRQCPAALVSRLEREGVSFHLVAAHDAGGGEDIAQTTGIALRCGAEWIALDGYHFGLSVQSGLRHAGFRIMALDDYGHSDTWCADVILNQNFDADDRAYVNRVVDADVLRGPAFALLRREFWGAADLQGGKKRGAMRRVLVTLGGVDADNVTGRVLAALADGETPALEIRVLLGAGNPHASELEAQARGARHAIEHVRNCTDMPAMYRWADGVISAAGSTCYEWMYLGLPAAVVVIAENQRPIANWLEEHGRATVLRGGEANSCRVWSSALARWVREGGANAGADVAPLVDAQGASRVVAALLARQNYVTAKEACHA